MKFKWFLFLNYKGKKLRIGKSKKKLKDILNMNGRRQGEETKRLHILCHLAQFWEIWPLEYHMWKMICWVIMMLSWILLHVFHFFFKFIYFLGTSKVQIEGDDWSQNMYSNSTCMIWFMQYKRLNLSKWTWIGFKGLVMDLTYILNLVLGLKD